MNHAHWRWLVMPSAVLAVTALAGELFMSTETGKWGKVVRAAGARVE